MSNDIICKDSPQLTTYVELLRKAKRRLERYTEHTKPLLGGEQYLTGEEVCRLLKVSSRTLQEYRKAGYLPHYKLGQASCKILYRSSDIERMLNEFYNPITSKRK